jgi:hypothetical protein
MEVNGQLHALAAFPPWKQPPVPIGWVGPRAGLDTVSKIKLPAPPKFELRSSDRPACDISLVNYLGDMVT